MATSVMETITSPRLSSQFSFWAQAFASDMLTIYICGEPSDHDK